MRKYQFVGDGAGVPGLPHVISQEEIDQLSKETADVFNSALGSGLYAEIPEPEPQPIKKTKKSSPADAGA